MLDPTTLREYVRLRKERDQAKAEFEEKEARYKELQADLYGRMEDDGTKTVRVDLGDGYGEFTFTRRQTVYGQVIDKDQALSALKEAGELHLLKEDFEKARLNEFVREHLEQGTPLPDGIGMRTADVVAISAKS